MENRTTDVTEVVDFICIDKIWCTFTSGDTKVPLSIEKESVLLVIHVDRYNNQHSQ